MDWKFIPILAGYLFLLYVIFSTCGVEKFFDDPINIFGFLFSTIFLVVYIVVINSGEPEEEEENDFE